MSPSNTTTDIPDHYKPGAQLSLQVEAKPIIVEVIHPITPFTMGQILIVRLSYSNEIAEQLNLPQNDTPFIVKVFDPRFFDDRRTREPPKPWTFAAKSEAVQKRGDNT
ncbi:hypothetical protein AN958_03940 [Leucoagaricus sp. SymC.cos]|nr:hypothetical protein AN958_03940 [Leucoagaricus sp. SymC.cos]